MATPFEILNQALNNNTLPSQEGATNSRIGETPAIKQATVASRSEEKQRSLLEGSEPVNQYQTAVNRGTERGVSSMSELERDLAMLSPSEILYNYGEEQGIQLLQEREAQQNQYYEDATRQYDSNTEPLTDALTNIGLGVTTAIGGPGAFAAGLINDEAGATIARGLHRATNIVHGVQSDRADAGRRITEARMAAELRDNADRAAREQEQIDFNRQATPDNQRSSFTERREDFQTRLRKNGRDILSSAKIATENPAYLAQGTAQGIGSIFAAGMLGKVIGAGAGAVIPESTKRGVQVAAAIDRANNTRSLTRGLDAIGRRSSVPLAIGAMEGGGTYVDVSNQIQNMSFEALEANSPNYRELIGQGMSPEDARTQLANDAGLRAGSRVAPLAAATGILVSRFEGNPFASSSMRNALQNIGKEGIEEGIQGGISGVGANEAIQTYADENRKWDKNVGRQIGEGAVLGLTSAGAIQSPGLAVNTVRETLGTDANIKRISDFTGSIVERADRVREANEAASPIADEKVAQASKVATENAEAAASVMREGIESSEVTPEEKTAANSYVDNLLGSLNVDPAAVEDPSVPQSIRDAVGGKTNRVEVIQSLADRIENSENDQEQVELGLALLNYMEPVIEISQTDPVAFEGLADDHPAIQALMTYKTLLASVTRSPKVDRALQTADNLLAQAAESNAVEINEETVNTPEGQREVQVAAAVASRHPDQGNLDTNEKILFQAQQGNLQLGDKERVALETSVNLLRSAKAYQEAAAAMGHPDASNVVSRQIMTDRANKEVTKQSALGFTQQIVGAMRQNDPIIAQARLEELGMFTQHMQNKVAAYNENFATGSVDKNTKYQALMPDRTWKESVGGVGLHPTKANSLRLAQTVALEAQMLADVYAGLRQAFPDLASPDVTPVSLDQRLIGKPNELAKQFASPQQTPAASTVTPTENTAEPATVPTEETNAAPEPTVEDTQADTTPVASVDTVPSLESIQAMDDATLNEQLNTMQELNQGNNSTAFTREYFNRLDNEMNLREDAAMQEAQQEEEAETAVPQDREVSTDNLSAIDSLRELQYQSDIQANALLDIALIDAPSALVPVIERLRDHSSLTNIEVDLTPFSGRKGYGSFGAFRGRDGRDTVTVNMGSLEQLANSDMGIPTGFIAEIIVHELIHAATYHEIENESSTRSTQLKTELQNIVDQLNNWKNSNPNEYTNLAPRTKVLIDHMLGSYLEVPTIALTNAAVQNVLRSIPVTDTSTVWSTFVNTIRNLLGMTSSETSLLDNALSITNQLLGDNLSPQSSDVLTAVDNTVEEADNSTAESTQEEVSVDNAEPITEQVTESVQEAEQDSTYTNLVNQEADLLAQLEDDQLTDSEAAALRAELVTVKRELEIQQGVVPEAETPRTIEAQFPNLIEGGEMVNMFKKAFTIPKQARTRTGVDTDPIQTITEAVSNPLAMTALVGEKAGNRLSESAAREYSAYIANAVRIREALNSRLEETLNKKGKSLKERQERAARYADTMLFNIIEPTENGFSYNKNLADNAVLAGMQWLLESEKYNSVITEDDIRSITGRDPVLVKPHVIDAIMNGGMSSADIKRSMAEKITKYWGVQANHNESLSYTQGIPEQMAAEVIEAMIDLGIVEVTETDISENSDGTKTLKQYKPLIVPDDSALRSFPTAIENAVLIEPDEINYIGDDVTIPVARTQMRNRLANNTKQQREAIERKQKVPFYIDTTMLNMVTSLGQGTLLELFGNGNLNDERKINNVHRKTLEGQNLTLSAAIEATNELVTEVKRKAEIAGVSLDQMPIRYAFNFSSVGRLHMLGKHNPQASKYSRELILPNQATLDLSTDTNADMRKFGLGMAQALGIKVHNMPWNTANSKLQSKLENELAPALDVVNNWLQNSDTTQADNVFTLPPQELAKLKASLDAGNVRNMAGLHALVEYARYQNSDNLNEFKTSLYLEADGVTNGVVNALNLLVSGFFTQSWKDNVARGGMYFNTLRSLNEHRSQHDSNDLYNAASDNFSQALHKQNKGFANNKQVTAQINNVMTVMGSLLKDITVTDDGNLVLDRGVTKNPLTITLYGSGASGIANNFVSELTEALYERMTEAANSNSTSTAEALFPDAADPQVEFNKFKAAMKELIDKKALVIKGELVISKNENSNKNYSDYENFEFTVAELDNLQTNLHRMFVEPLRVAITQTVGAELMSNAELLRVSSQVQSIYEAQMFQKKIKEKREALEMEGVRTKSEYLSRNELDEIAKSLENVSPRLNTGNQILSISGSAKAEDSSYNNFSSSLTGTLRTGPFINGPKDAGVRGIPLTVIGSGDGMMMQYITLEQLEGTLEIFDGMHMPLDKIDEYSTIANEAVYKTWQGNPLRALQTSYESFLENAEFNQLNQKELDEISKAILGNDGVGTDQASVVLLVQRLLPKLKNAADSIEARHRTIDSMSVSIDQMAAAASPYQNLGDSFDSSITDAELLAEMNRRYQENLATIQSEENVTKVDPSKIGVATVSGAFAISGKNFRNLRKLAKLTPEQESLHREIVRSRKAEEYTVIMGTPEQIEDYQLATGRSVISGSDIKRNGVSGFITPENKTIYIANGSVETLLHEMVHAATFETLQNYYHGESLGNNATEVSDAIQRIEQLKVSFMNLDRTAMTEEQSIAYDRAVASISNAENNLELTTETANAIALNEFMAWSLTNAELSSGLRRVKAPKLVQLARDVVAKIKEIIWGNKKAPELATNMFSTLQFNTAIVMSAQPSLSERQRRSVLFQSNGYGTSDRLTQISETFTKTISDFITESTGVNESKALQQRRDAAIAAATLASRVQANGYPMTKQEEITFQQVIAAMSMETSLDANVMNEAQKLYTHVSKNMDLGFMSDPRFTQDVRLDANDRSALLPVFLGLALTNDKFRSELSLIALPKGQRNRNDSLDNVLSNLAQGTMDQLSTRLSGQTRSSDVQAAIDALADRLEKTVKDRETFIDQMSDGATGLADRSNQLVIDGMTALSDRVYKFSKQVQADPKRNKYEKMLARSGELLSSLANQERAEAVSEGVVASINEVEGSDPLRALLSDITGRTESNASVYDLIKPVRAQIQRIRQNFRKDVPVIIAKKFKTELKKEQWAMMTRGMANTDLAALVDTYSRTEVLEILGNESSRQAAIEEVKAAIQTADAANATLIDQKSMQLAHYMNTGEPGKNLLRNSNAIASLLNEMTAIPPIANNDVIRAVDQLVTLYAIDGLAQTDKDSLGLLAQSEAEGMDFTLAYLVGQRKEELVKSQTGRARFNHYKGYIRQNAQTGVSMTVAEDTQFARLKGLGYERVGNYVGSSSERSTVARGYYFMPVSSRAAFSQGIFQNAHKTAYGVNAHTGYSEGMTAGTITDKATVKQITRRLQRETATNEALMAVFDETGQVVGYERAVDPSVTRPALNQETHLGNLIGEWRGRQVEEAKSQVFNEVMVDRLKQMHDEHKNTGRNPNEYVNLFDQEYLKKNPVIADAVSLLTGDTLDYIQEVFDEGFYVRKDMLKDAIGYRNASVGDAWTGTTNWSPEVQKTVRNLAVTAFGNKAYRYLVNTENTLENIMGEVRTTIVVRSVIIPVVNFMSNVFQLISAGVPLKNITTELPKKLSEIHSYTESYARMTEAQAELLAASENSALSRKLQAEIQSIEDSHRRLSIWPLLEAGEFSTVADIGRVTEDTTLTTGKLGEYMENLADKMPPGLRTAARYGIVSKDTALYQGLQKSVLYGDFISKAVLYDDLVKRQRKSKKEALAQITEEFVNYDVLPGRFRGKLENIGLLWFYNFKIRSAKVAASRMRNNPVHTLMAMTLPGRDVFGNAGLPIEDNVFTKAAEGSLGYSMGPGMAGSAIGLNPWVNLAQ